MSRRDKKNWRVEQEQPPIYSSVAAQWPWVLKWWASLVSILSLPIPIVVILVGSGHLNLPDSVFIAYVSAATGGNTILAIAGTLLLRPFSRLNC